mgnify:FL=1
MANYNYVAPIQYKSYSDMNKERLAAKAAKEAAGLKQKSTIDTRKQKFYDNMTGYKTAGWADSHRTEYNMQVQRALSEVALSPNPDYGGISDAIMRMQEIGDNHANLRDGQTEYNSYMGENAPNYDADLDWGMIATHDKTGYDERLTTFNNLGLLNYSNGKGDFPNPNYDPSAAEGTAGSFKSMRDLLKSKGVDIQMSNGREVYADEDGQLKPISGSAFDVATEQFSGLWNPTLSAINNITAEDAFFGYSNIPGGKAKFENHAITLNKQVADREITYEAAKENLKADILNYVDPEGVSPDRALISSAITAYDEGTGQTWDDAGTNDALINTYGTPWDYFADQMVATANLDDPDKPSGGKMSESMRLKWASFYSKPLDTPHTKFTRTPVGTEGYNWEKALEYYDEKGNVDVSKIVGEIDEVDEFGNITGTKTGIKKDLGEGIRVGMKQEHLKYDNVPVQSIEIFEESNIVIIYASDYIIGDVGIDVGEEGSPWRYNPLFGGRVGVAPFRIINLTNPDGSEHDDMETLRNQFRGTYGGTDPLQQKIIEAEQARE